MWIDLFKKISVNQLFTEILVTPSREVSNFLIEDYEAVLKLMNTEAQKRNPKLK